MKSFTLQAKSDSHKADAGPGATPSNELETSGEATTEGDPNQERRKRRKTSLPDNPFKGFGSAPRTSKRPESGNWLRQLQLEAKKSDQHSVDASTCESAGRDTASNDIAPEPLPDSVQPSALQPEPIALASRGGPVDDHMPGADAPQPTTPKKKVLKVTKSGKLVSPLPDLQNSTSPKRKRGRPAKAKPSLIVTIKYGSNRDGQLVMGQIIDDILNSKTTPARRPVTPKKVTPKKVGPVKPIGPPKPTHPFFSGKPTQKEEAQPKETNVDKAAPPPRTPKRSAVTPGKLRAEMRGPRSPEPMPAFGPIGRDNRAMNMHGMKEAPWPQKGFSHVRDDETMEMCASLPITGTEPYLSKPRKLKHSANTISPDEDLIFCLARQLNPSSHQATHVDLGHVRLPTRLLTTGPNLQQRVCKEVKAPLSASDEYEGVHPAIQRIFKDIENSLTPFDKGQCEPQSWVQKYAPIYASDVLQSGKEAIVLRDWLQNLTVMAVHGKADGGQGTTGSEPRKPPKKKRKKLEDDFIIYDDDADDDELMEMSDGEQYGPLDPGSFRLRSLRLPRMSRNKNVIIISGPQGCGKTATVYAVAKELGFEVFEINSGSRRSAKDIQDKVGDMSENHLVNHKRDERKAPQDILPIEDDDDERRRIALEKDIQSGRQGTMTSFFQSKPQTTPKPKPKPKTKEPQPRKAASAAQATLTTTTQKPQKTQKQSLILFEEADVLFEEDQQFWLQVTKLAFQSKRPIIITCNDESLIPAHQLPIGAILRLAPPPVALATDYLLTLAAKEGHLLERKAVSDLYTSKGQDLRASIAELDFWCQMSVGDRKGGLDWIFQRWPPGKDVDEKGRVFRVASEGTYQSGMGMVSHDVSAEADKAGFDKEEELLKEVWADWGVGPAKWRRNGKEMDGTIPHPQSSNTALEDLRRLNHMLDAVSSADIYCRVGLPSYDGEYEEPTDPSLPPISDKERQSYTVDAPFLQVDHISDFSSFDTDMLVQSHLRLQRAYGDNPALRDHTETWHEINGNDEFTQLILQNQPKSQKQQRLQRSDFSAAFDPLADTPTTTLALSSSYQLLASSFDRTFKIIVEDLAPFVRSIVSHELRLEAERIRTSSLLSAGGRSKRSRTTRASRVALEGGTRQEKRRERWFEKDLNRELVMATAGRSWAGLGSMSTEETDGSESKGDGDGDSLVGSQG